MPPVERPRRFARFVAPMCALALLSLVPAASASARSQSASSCGHPKVLTGYDEGVDYGAYRVNNDVWTKQGKQTMRVCSASDWTATAMQNGAPASGVKTFPDSGKVYTDWTHCRSQPSLGSFKKLTSTFTEHAPNAASWDFAYDVFLDGAVCGKPRIEVMVFEQWSHVDLPATRLHTTLGGTTYDVYHSGRYIQLRRRAQTASGSVDLRAVFQYLAREKLVKLGDTLQFVQAGFEILTTHGKDVPFRLTRFSVADRR